MNSEALARKYSSIDVVQVEVIAAEVGEHGDVEPRAGDPVQREGVRRHLHHHRLDALVDVAGELALQVGRLGRGARARQRADRGRVAMPAPAQDRRHQVGGRGLAVGAGDADHA